jgi:hypothetical protein
LKYEKADFIPFSADAQRVAANLEQGYSAWISARRDVESLPVSMYWQAKEGVDYLSVKHQSSDPGTSIGRRDPQTQARYDKFIASKADLKERVRSADAMIAERAGLYRRLRLPSIADQLAEILRTLDVEDMLGTDLLVVGANAFVAYKVVCAARFPTGYEATEDFDLAWCRGSKASLASAPLSKGRSNKTLLGVLRRIDPSYAINKRKPYQAVNANGYEVELLAAPSTHPLPDNEAFEPMALLVEQEWLLQGMPVAAVVATQRGRACPLHVPDPRWMALHKLWLARKSEQNAAKRPKDRRQGEVLLDAVRFFLTASHPLDVDFLMTLPAELLPLFDEWCAQRQFVPEL